METWKKADSFAAVRGKVNGNFEEFSEALTGLKGSKAEVVYGMYTGNGTESSVELGFRPKALIVSAHGSYNAGGSSGIYTMISLGENSCEFLKLNGTGFTASSHMCYAQSNSNPYRYLAFR